MSKVAKRALLILSCLVFLLLLFGPLFGQEFAPFEEGNEPIDRVWDTLVGYSFSLNTWGAGRWLL